VSPSSSHPPCYSERLDEAIALAVDAFRSKVRKGSQIPYVTHLLQVLVTVAEHGGDEEQLIAAVLHDYLEDIRGAERAVLAQRFGERVARLVEGLSDSTTHPKPPWQERKESYLQALATEPHELKLISTADKLHNATSILRDYRLLREEVWDRFTATREQTLWYYRAAYAALSTGWQHPLLDDLRRVIVAMHEEAGESIEL